jgi:sugar phosphate isomerase/epimerase
MNRLKLGIVLETTGLPVRKGLAAVSDLPIHGVQIDATGTLAPEQLTETGRREFGNLLRSHNLELSALNCPLRHGLDAVVGSQQRIDHLRGVMLLAADLGCRKVIVSLPRLPDDPESPRAVLMRDALWALGSFGDRIGTQLALGAGLDLGDKVADYLSTFDTGALGVNFDPVNSVLSGADPLAALAALGDRVIHTRARDVRTTAGSGGREVPIGTGEIDWVAYAATLESIGYRGYLVVDREAGADRFADVVAGVRYLARFAPVSG